jgi:hypothetical protein
MHIVGAAWRIQAGPPAEMVERTARVQMAAAVER